MPGKSMSRFFTIRSSSVTKVVVPSMAIRRRDTSLLTGTFTRAM